MATPAAAPQAEEQPTTPPEGEDAQGSGLYDLKSVPEHLRPHLEPLLKEIDGNVTKRFQESADFRKQWEPFAETGIADIPREDVSGLVELYSIIQDEDQFKDWLRNAATEFGILDADTGADDIEDDDDFDLDENDPSGILKQVGTMLDERLGPIEKTTEAQQQKEAISQAEKQIRTELDKLHEDNGEFDEDAVMRLGMAYDTPDGIQKAFADYKRIKGDSQRELVEDKLDQPETPIEGGATPVEGNKPMTFDEASAAALARLRQQKAT